VKYMAMFHCLCYFQRMLKEATPVKQIERMAGEAIRSLLAEVPSISVESLKTDWPPRGARADVVVEVEIKGTRYTLVCEAKQHGQPRFVRDAIYQLKDYLREFPISATAVVVAPYLSPESREMCIQSGVSYLDFEGNARLAFGPVFIDRIRANKPSPDVRELKSLFRSKSAQILRVLFRDPNRGWKVADLAKAAAVSLGHASNVRAALLNREWGQLTDDGLCLRGPSDVLNAWKEAYIPPVSERLAFYTTLHGSLLESRVKEFFDLMPNNAQTALGSFSAAEWIAPYGRTNTLFLWSQQKDVEEIRQRFQLSPSGKGENVVVSLTQDSGVFFDMFVAEGRIRCTSPLQTYLDLAKSGERGGEAAEHLRRMRLSWTR
jgi:Transcriptional regulator, AbiEi antitoxin, Type IV TA system